MNKLKTLHAQKYVHKYKQNPTGAQKNVNLYAQYEPPSRFSHRPWLSKREWLKDRNGMITTFDLFVKKPCFWQRKPVFIFFIVSHLSGTYAGDWQTTT